MRAGLRWTTPWLCGALALATPALAQSTSDQPASTPPSDAVGPAELQNFSLKGSATKPADQSPPAPAPQPKVQLATPALTDQTAAKPQRRSAETHPAPVRTAPAPTAKSTQLAQSVAPRPSLALPAAPATTAGAVPSFTQPPAAAPLPSAPAAPLPPERQFPILPWVAAALALAGGIAFLLWRRRPREALAGPEFDLFVPPEPAPAPPPVPAPRTATAQPVAAPPKTVANKGIVSTRLRPQVEIAVQPLRCSVDGEQVVLDFELELFNAGAAPARAVHAETALFNAGTTQEQQLSAFFTNPVGAGERLDVIPPMKRVTFSSQVVAPRSQIQEYELAGRKTIVPVLAFNALYEWSGGKAQTSAAFLVGREMNKDKLGPLALNGAAREFHGLGVRALASELRN